MRKLFNFLPYYIYFLLGLPWLLVLAPLSFRGRETIRQVCRKLGFSRHMFSLLKPAAYPMPRRCIGEILALDFNVALAHPNGQEGSVSTYELLILNALVKKSQPGLVVEFGTLDGRTALNFALNAPRARVLTLDFARPSKPLFAGTAARRRIETVVGDSLEFDTRKYRGRAGFVFIDGGHDAPVVMSDSRKALELTAPGGVVVWHDYTNFPGVQKAVALAMRGARGRFYQVKDTSMAVYFASQVKARRKRA